MHCYKQFNLLKSWYLQDAKQPHRLAVNAETEFELLQNQLRVSDAHFAWLCITEDVMIALGLSDQARRAKLRAMHKCLLEQDFVTVMTVCKASYDLLLEFISQKRGLVTSRNAYSEFKALLADFEPSVVSAVLAPIKQGLALVLDHLTPTRNNGVYHSEVCCQLELVTQYLTFLNKLEISNPDLRVKAIEDYKCTEVENASYSVRDDDDDLKFIQYIIGVWFSEFRVDWTRVKHGPGSVADTDTISRSAKNWALLGSPAIDFLFNSTAVFTGDDLHSEEVNPTMGVLKELLSIKGLDATSQLTCVPKNATKLRTISMEPATLQYLQQAAKESLYDYIEHNPVGLHIHIKNQLFNRAYAYDGSIQDNFATLDLSHASDSVTLQFVKQAFKNVPYMRRVLMLTRSTHTNVDGDKLNLLKFAPMGSALCFPVECILFAAIAARSVQLGIKCGLLNHNDPNSNHFSVYGDDTIVPVAVADICEKLLEKFGFSVNKLKSYKKGPFKESCGGNYYCGHDITGLKYNPRHTITGRGGNRGVWHRRISPNSYQALITYANFARLKGYKVFRCFCIWRIKAAGLKPLFTTNVDDSSSIHTDVATNYMLPISYDASYQRCVYEYSGIKPKRLTNKDDDFYLYYQSFIRAAAGPKPTYKQRRLGPYIQYTYKAPAYAPVEGNNKRYVHQDDRCSEHCVMRVDPHDLVQPTSGPSNLCSFIDLEGERYY